jgi:hypothetical protein
MKGRCRENPSLQVAKGGSRRRSPEKTGKQLAGRVRIVVFSGLVDCPVIAVPTSVGYGAAFNGMAHC